MEYPVCFLERRWRDLNSRAGKAGLPHFECGPFSHLGTSPQMILPESILNYNADGKLRQLVFFRLSVTFT